MAMRCSGVLPPVPALATGGEDADGPLIVTVELEVTEGKESEVTATVTVLFPGPVMVAFNGNCAVPSADAKNWEIDGPDWPFAFTIDAVTGPVVPIIAAE